MYKFSSNWNLSQEFSKSFNLIFTNIFSWKGCVAASRNQYINWYRLRSEAVSRKCSVKEVFLEISQNSQENTCTRVSFLIKLSEGCNFIKKETLAQVFSCEFCEISKNTFSYRTPPVAGSLSCDYLDWQFSIFWRTFKSKVLRTKVMLLIISFKMIFFRFTICFIICGFYKVNVLLQSLRISRKTKVKTKQMSRQLHF